MQFILQVSMVLNATFKAGILSTDLIICRYNKLMWRKWSALYLHVCTCSSLFNSSFNVLLESQVHYILWVIDPSASTDEPISKKQFYFIILGNFSKNSSQHFIEIIERDGAASSPPSCKWMFKITLYIIQFSIVPQEIPSEPYQRKKKTL